MILFLLLAQLQHTPHPKILPTDPQTWQSCCHEHDCAESSILVQKLGNQYRVSVANYPPIMVAGDRVHRSQNGKSYICTWGAQLPPTSENVLCVFYIDPSMVMRR